MNIIEKSIKEIKPYKKNAKKHDKSQIDNVAESIRQFGFVQPLVIDKDGVIVIGHCRYEAAKQLKMDSVPCVLVDELTEEQIKSLRVIDNKTNESPWDLDLLDDELSEIDLGGFDFDFEGKKKEEKDDGEIPFTEILEEENNYIILKFENSIDWLQLQSIFNLPTVKAYSTRTDGKITKSMVRNGFGRVVNGAEFLTEIGVEI